MTADHIVALETKLIEAEEAHALWKAENARTIREESTADGAPDAENERALVAEIRDFAELCAAEVLTGWNLLDRPPELADRIAALPGVFVAETLDGAPRATGELITEWVHDDAYQWDLEPPAEPAESDSGKKSQATQLVELAEAMFTFGVTEAGEPYAVERGGPNLAQPFRGGRHSLGASLAEAFYTATGRAPTAAARADALAVLEGKAARLDPHEPALRVGRDQSGAVVIDRGTADGAAIRLAGGTYQLLDRSPVLFARTGLVAPLPEPAALGARSDLDRLRRYINVTDTSWPLVVAWLVAALVPEVAHPIKALLGEQGTAKTTTGRYCGALIDPSAAPVRSAPRNEESWATQAFGSWLVLIDNVSSIQPWLSDALCRAVTGDALVKRRLYTDAGVSVLRFRRVVTITSVDTGALRGDLAERLLPIELERIAPDRRRSESDLDTAFAADYPRMLAGLYSLTAQVLEALPTVELATLPRMADFARIVAAIDRIEGTDTLAAYLGALDRVNADVVADDPVASAIVEFGSTEGAWEGTAADLLAALATDERERHRNWPNSPRALVTALNRCAPALRTVGMNVEQLPRTKHARRWRIRQTEIAGNRPSPPSPPSPAPETQLSEGDGRGDRTVTPSPPPSPRDPLNHAEGDAGDAGDAGSPAFFAQHLCTECGTYPAVDGDLCEVCAW